MNRFFFLIMLLSVFCVVAGEPKKISGIFDAGWNSYFRSAEQWETQVERIKALNMNTIVFQYSITANDHQFFKSSLSWASAIPDHEHFSRSIPAAHAAGLDIYIGLYAENSGWWKTADNTYLIRQRERCIELVDSLEVHFPYSTIKGYYIAHEIARYYWSESQDLKRLKEQFVKPVADYIHNKTTKKLLISPFFNPDLETSDQLYHFFADFFPNSGVDIVAVQDGIGVNPDRLAVVGRYLRAIDRAAAENGIESWVNVELFDTNQDDQISVPFSRIRLQIDSANAVESCSKIISYDYSSLTGDHYAHTMNGTYDSLKSMNGDETIGFEQKMNTSRFLRIDSRGTITLTDRELVDATVSIIDMRGKIVLASAEFVDGLFTLPTLHFPHIIRVQSARKSICLKR